MKEKINLSEIYLSSEMVHLTPEVIQDLKERAKSGYEVAQDWYSNPTEFEPDWKTSYVQVLCQGLLSALEEVEKLRAQVEEGKCIAKNAWAINSGVSEEYLKKGEK